MSEYRDIKAMKRAGHSFADGGFSGSAGVQSVKPYTRKPSTGKPKKPDFARRATTPGGLANGGMAPQSTSKVAMSQGTYAKGGKVKHDDVAQDKALVKASVHKHERAMHPGKPVTPLKSGGLSAAANFNRAMKTDRALEANKQAQPKRFASGGKTYSRKPMVGC